MAWREVVPGVLAWLGSWTQRRFDPWVSHGSVPTPFQWHRGDAHPPRCVCTGAQCGHPSVCRGKNKRGGRRAEHQIPSKSRLSSFQ